ncbi:hypothetical protein [Roseobacter sp. CCS2]|uniref:hypothetical protein n=1 Tax=Roseobacter sp. CCS2 TaxID=391593 RepID=UPI0000F40061|nr:hypothetical protein [Roseobacter sp. CCS2]EBA13426.1 Internalin G [Roseobacter sp. CCS2]
MTVEPDFPIHAQLNQALGIACGPARVPEGKGGHVYVDGTLHRILDIKRRLKGTAAYAFSVNEKELIHMCAHLDVAVLGFKGLRTTTIAPLQDLRRLRNLSLWWVQKLADLSPLSDLMLAALVLDGIRNANDITPISAIKTLRALTIAGGINSDQKINTLEPLTKLPHLRELRMMAIKLDDDSLRPLARCGALRDLNLPSTFPTEDYAYLRAKRPDLRCMTLAAHQKASYVSEGKNIMVTGRRKPFLSSTKDVARLAKYEAQFNALVVKYQAADTDDA